MAEPIGRLALVELLAPPAILLLEAAGLLSAAGLPGAPADRRQPFLSTTETGKSGGRGRSFSLRSFSPPLGGG